jgi:hypothetical protein
MQTGAGIGNVSSGHKNHSEGTVYFRMPLRTNHRLASALHRHLIVPQLSQQSLLFDDPELGPGEDKGMRT